MNYLGLDYGEKNIGVAIATGPLAEPLTTILTAKALPSIKALIEKQEISGLVIGVTDNTLHPTVKELAHQLSSLNTPIFLVDETLTSHDARQALLHTTQSRRKNLEHSIAATIILQSWLDSRHANVET